MGPRDARRGRTHRTAVIASGRMRLQQVAPTSATVLLLGETGTGKGLAAREVHRLSTRGHARFLAVDCGSLPPTLIESELFGRERGAFTDARSTQIGRFELADGGTIAWAVLEEADYERRVVGGEQSPGGVMTPRVARSSYSAMVWPSAWIQPREGGWQTLWGDSRTWLIRAA